MGAAVNYRGDDMAHIAEGGRQCGGAGGTEGLPGA